MEDGFPRVTSPPPVHPLLQKKTETRLHTSPLHIADSRGDGLSSSSASKPTVLQTEAGAENNMDPSNEEDDRNLDSEQQTHRISKRKSPERKVKKGEGAERDCKVCGVAFRHLAALIRHSWSHVEQQQDLCGVCEETFDSVEKLKEHLRTHLKIYRCAFCGINFVSILRLKKHTTRHKVKRVARCQVCKQTFTNMSDLHHHRQVHRKEKPHQCHICLRSFNLKDRLSVQRGDLTKEGKYTCDICNKSSKPSACDPGPVDPLSRLGPHLQSLKETL
uniref:C2H2-type domain-containing protein n=2 Tax=Nothobranchius furzeri TaxID=105023 RepID=A0A1A8UER8_NOTFU